MPDNHKSRSQEKEKKRKRTELNNLIASQQVLRLTAVTRKTALRQELKITIGDLIILADCDVLELKLFARWKNNWTIARIGARTIDKTSAFSTRYDCGNQTLAATIKTKDNDLEFNNFKFNFSIDILNRTTLRDTATIYVNLEDLKMLNAVKRF